MTKGQWAKKYAMIRFRRCFPPKDKALRDEMQAILEQAMRIGNLTAEQPWSVIGAHVAALRLAKAEMDVIEAHLKMDAAGRSSASASALTPSDASSTTATPTSASSTFDGGPHAS